MILKKAQKNQLLKWIAEGLKSGEINKRAAKLKQPFHVSPSQVAWYRDTRGVKLEQIREEDEKDALRTGFALKEERVSSLKTLATTLLNELTREDDNRLWTQNAKGLGGGENWEKYEYEEFNKAEIDSLRGLLDDIAAELGHRSKRDANLNIDLSKLTDAQLERIANGEDLLKVLINA